MLKHISDPDIYIFFEKSMKGGVDDNKLFMSLPSTEEVLEVT